jgi:hypothetical protein
VNTSAAAALEATFTGTATVTTTYAQAPGPYVEPIQIGLRFDDARTAVEITSFPTIKTEPFQTPFGMNTTTITKIGGGSGTYNSGALTMPLTLRFDHSVNLPFVEEDSTQDVVLSTNPPGAPVDSAGKVTLAGSAPFKGGILGGSTGSLTIEGTIAPVP